MASFKHLYLIKPQMVNVLTSKGRCSSPNWRGGTYSSLDIWLPEKNQWWQEENLKWNFLIWPYFFPAGSLFSGCKGYICTAGLNTPRTVLSSWQGMNHLHGITLSLPAAQSGCRQTDSWEWSLGSANSQTTPVDCDIRMCWRLARNCSNKLTIWVIKFQGLGTFLGTVIAILQ